jgi:hypothetical protein
MGVPLKNMWDALVEPIDWDELAAYARELAPDDSDADGDDQEATKASDVPPIPTGDASGAPAPQIS